MLDTEQFQYADYTRWQSEGLAGNRLAYWKKHLIGAAPVLELPTDHPRPAQPSFRGAMHPFALSQQLTVHAGAVAAAGAHRPRACCCSARRR